MDDVCSGVVVSVSDCSDEQDDMRETVKWFRVQLAEALAELERVVAGIERVHGEDRRFWPVSALHHFEMVSVKCDEIQAGLFRAERYLSDLVWVR